VPTPLTPGSVEYAYGLGKRQAEEILAAAQEAGDFTAVRLRFPVVGGPADPTGRFAGYVARLGDGDPLLIPDGGFNTFRHVYVKDAAAAVLAAMEHPGPGQGWNIASREIFSVRDLVREMAACLGRPEPVVVAPPPRLAGRARQPGHLCPFQRGPGPDPGYPRRSGGPGFHPHTLVPMAGGHGEHHEGLAPAPEASPRTGNRSSL
jgi:nucleoside-diphosphate-sugar epimerase